MSAAPRGRSAEARSHIPEVPRRLLALRGPEEVTVAEVAADVGVARATVFDPFGSKHARIEALAEDVLGGCRLLLDRELGRRDAPLPTLVRALFRRMGEAIREDRRRYRAPFREIAKLSLGASEGEPGRRARQANLERLLHPMTRGQARGLAAGVFPAGAVGAGKTTGG